MVTRAILENVFNCMPKYSKVAISRQIQKLFVPSGPDFYAVLDDTYYVPNDSHFFSCLIFLCASSMRQPQ